MTTSHFDKAQITVDIDGIAVNIDGDVYHIALEARQMGDLAIMLLRETHKRYAAQKTEQTESNPA